MLADICAVLNPVLKYGRQRDAAALAVAGLTSARNIHDEIEIGFATMAPASIAEKDDPLDAGLRTGAEE